MGRSVEVAGHRAPDTGSDSAIGPAESTWQSSGLAELTGRAYGPPLDPPPGLVPGVRALAETISRNSEALGRRVMLDPLAVLCDRARLGKLRRRGPISCGGSARLLRTADGWMSVNLARPTDWELLPAWLGLADPVVEGEWALVAEAVAERTGEELLDRASGLGLPMALVGERMAHGPAWFESTGYSPGISMRQFNSGLPPDDMADLVVADLSALWAGPLVGSVLAMAGAHVLKIESTARPDGARRGSPAHFASLNTGKSTVRLDFGTPAGRQELRRIVERADVVVTSARPRAVSQLGLDPERSVRDGRPRVWLSITGYGGDPAAVDRVAFGDDAAAAGGLVVWDDAGPCFCADAVADPTTGLAAAGAVMDALARGGGYVIDASMADVAAGLVGTPAVHASGGARST